MIFPPLFSFFFLSERKVSNKEKEARKLAKLATAMETALGPAKSLSNGQTKPKFVVFFPVIKLQ